MSAHVTPFSTYLVGGAVRDHLYASLPVRPNPATHDDVRAPVDLDWVVVGTHPDAMVALGFEPVGRDFPVFLHPHTHQEYALARTERKTAKGYHGFAFLADPSVTLEQDLARRDLTVNAMAVPASVVETSGTFRFDPAQVIDPYGGVRDLHAGLLRHVTTAFAEDPVRILRIARFAARWPAFSVAPETMALMQHMVASGEVDHVVAERVWQELSRGLMERQPSRMLSVLHDCGALQVLLPEVNDVALLERVIDTAARLQAPLAVRYACLCHNLGLSADSTPRARQVSARWRVPKDCKALADVVAHERMHIDHSMDAGPAAILRLLERCDAIRRPERFGDVLQACQAIAATRPIGTRDAYPQATRLHLALHAALTVATAPIAARVQAQCESVHRVGQDMATAIAQAREAAIATALTSAAPSLP